VDEYFAHRPRPAGRAPRVLVRGDGFSQRRESLFWDFELPQILAFEAGYSLRHGQRPFHGDIILVGLVHRPSVLKDAEPGALTQADNAYHVILRGADLNTQKSTYLDAMDNAKAALIELRSRLVVVNVEADAAPDFSPLTTDAEMKAILERRWIECTKCVGAKAHLAAIVMMGGLLEALFVARGSGC
jgi:hypothetical protein